MQQNNQIQIDQIKQLLKEQKLLEASNQLLRLIDNSAAKGELKDQAIMVSFDIRQLQNTHNIELTSSQVHQKIITDIQNLLQEFESIAPKPVEDTPEQAKHLQDYFLQQQPAQAITASFQNIKKTYRKSGFTLGPVSLDLRFGKITGLVGENGNGKTTLIKIIAGLLAPDEGEFAYPALSTSESIYWLEVKQQIGYIPQSLDSWSGTVLQNLYFMGACKGFTPEENEKEVNYIIHRLGLVEYMDMEWEELSGGYQMRFELARTLLWKPKLLILDEPLASLDINAQSIFLRDLRY